MKMVRRKPTSIEPVPEAGPAMRALPARWQRCVDALFVSGGDRSAALRLAGYEGKPESMNVMASRIFADDRVRAAVKEECTRRIDISEPELYSVAMNILRDQNEKAADRLRAVSMVWDRANPVMSKHRIEVEHYLSQPELEMQHYRALQKLGAPRDAFLARFGPNGLPRIEQMIAADEAKRRQIEGDVIEADYEEVEVASPVQKAVTTGHNVETTVPAGTVDEALE